MFELAGILIALLFCSIALCCQHPPHGEPLAPTDPPSSSWRPDSSHWHWDCPDNPLGHPPRCLEVTPCGTVVDHPLESCCLEALGSGGAWRHTSYQAREECSEG